MELKLSDIVEHLRSIKTSHGEEEYLKAVKSFAVALLAQEGQDLSGFVTKVLSDLQETSVDVAELQVKAEEVRTRQRAKAQELAEQAAKAKDPNEVFMNAVRAQMPSLKTQAHFDLFMQGFQALQVFLNAAYSGDFDMAKKAREALDQVLDLGMKVYEIDQQLRDTPEAATNPDFVEAPKEFTERDTFNHLMQELAGITSLERVHQWYEANKPQLDRITTQTLRNEIYDAIRTRRNQLSN